VEVAVVAQHLGKLTLGDVEAAIVWGETGGPAPLLHYYLGPENATVVGAVYTPYVCVALAAVALPGDPVVGVPRPRPLEAPLWVRRDLSQLAALGGPAYPDTVLLVGYRPDAAARGGDIVTFREVPSRIVAGGMDHRMRMGRITAKDLANWR
jgi:hypothetical protein